MRKPSLATALPGLAALSLLVAPAAQAAGEAAAPAAPAAPAPAAAPMVTATIPVMKGPLVAGLCLLSQEGLISRSKAGQAATAHLQDMAHKIQSDLAAEQARLQARGKALEAKRATMTPLQLETEGKALNQRMQALQASAGDKQREMEAAKSQAYGAVIKQAEPLVSLAYAAHACGLLMAREAIYTGNLDNDLTPEVIAAMDAQSAAPPPTAAAAPAAPPAPPKK